MSWHKSERNCLKGEISNTPGPGAYKASGGDTSSWSFGSSANHVGPKAKGVSQGPTYDTVGHKFGASGLAARSPAASFGSGHKSPTTSAAPGPGTYAPRGARSRPSSANSRGYGFGASMQHVPPKVVGNAPIGPGAYEHGSLSAHGRRSQAASFGSGHTGPRIVSSPAPGDYDAAKPKANVPGNIGFGIGSAHFGPKQVGEAPVGPGAYSSSRGIAESSRGAGFGSGHEGPRIVASPAPGEYDADAPRGNVQSTVGFGAGSAHNGPKIKGSAPVGPGEYDTTRGIRGTGRSAGFGSGHEGPRISSTPAPGDYEAVRPSSARPGSAGFGSLAATVGPKPIGTAQVGPGAYETPRGIADAPAKGVGFGSGHGEPKANGVPSPADYNPGVTAHVPTNLGFGSGSAHVGPSLLGCAPIGPGAYANPKGIGEGHIKTV